MTARARERREHERGRARARPDEARTSASSSGARLDAEGGAAALAEPALEALELLLRGVSEAAARDGDRSLQEALARDEQDLVYTALLTALLRVLFVLFAEDRGLLPARGGLRALHEQLVDDAAREPDATDTWPKVLARLRAVFGEDGAGRGGALGPVRVAFLEGEETPEGARPPSIRDETVARVLDRLLLVDGARRSYRALEVEQLGGVYEALMGYRVARLSAPSVCLRPHRVWVSVAQLRARPTRSARSRWLKGQGLSAAQARAIEEALATSDAAALAALEALAVRGRPVARAGRLVLQPGEARRRSGSHYTPRELSTPIVERTLEPLLRRLGPRPASARLLSLAICDPAMGSGAFLLAACRALAVHVVDAWVREGAHQGLDEAELRARAKRLVARRCLYGVDKDPLAVELARRSLWLEVESPGAPLDLVDHALKPGDALVGLLLAEARAFDWDARARDGAPAIDRAVQKAMFEHAALRADARREGGSSRATAAAAATTRARIIADLALGAFFEHDTDARRRAARDRRRALVEAWLRRGEGAALPPELAAALRRARAQGAFHWPLEFPELFLEEPGGGDDGPRRFDAVIGNPPFMGGFQVSGALGDGYRDWLLRLHEHAHGNADYAAHFLRRARALLGEDGAFGLITTNTVYQGDTRATGLQPLVRGGGVLYHATRSRPWPGEAAVTVSVVHAAFGRAIEGVARRVLDGRVVPVINSRLRPAPERDDPARLEANAGMSFLGSKIYGQGFILSPAERERLIARREENARRIVPYLGGEEINAHPRHAYHRYVISFGAMSLEEAARWPELLEIVRERVKPERDTNRRALRRRYWWRFGEVAPALYEAIRPLPRCLVLSRHSKHLAFTFVDPRAVFSEATQVFPITCDARFAVLQSRAHEPWARLLSSSLEDRLRYSASDCFETFPFPDAHALAPGGPLGAAGKALFEARARYMVETERGLTKTYNLLKDPARRCPRLQRLRALHESMDRAALAAYGWEDLRPPPITAPRSRAEARAREAFEDALLDRLFALNAARAAAERRRRGSA